MEYWKIKAYCKGLNTFATKVYGEWWDADFVTAKDEWDRWLIGKGDDKAYYDITYREFLDVMEHLDTPPKRR